VPRANFTGTWHSIPAKNVNYEEFLSVQGVPYMKRKIALSSVVKHMVDHKDSIFKLEVGQREGDGVSSLITTCSLADLSSLCLGRAGAYHHKWHANAGMDGRVSYPLRAGGPLSSFSHHSRCNWSDILLVSWNFVLKPS
jgi:hypothetical protein